MEVTYLDPSGSQIGKKESIADTARVLGRMFDGIEYRGYGQQIVEELAHYAGVPVWNGLTNEFPPHPDSWPYFLIIQEHFGHLKASTSFTSATPATTWEITLMIASAKMGMDFVSLRTEEILPERGTRCTV